MRLAVIGALMLLFAQNSSKKPIQSNGQNQAQSSNPSSPTILLTCDERSSPVAERDQEKAPKWYATIEWANWALVVVAGITGYVIWQQTIATRQSVLVNLRPKITIPAIALYIGEVGEKNGLNVVIDEGKWSIECMIANVGRGRARIVESNLTFAPKLGIGDSPKSF